MGLGKLRSCGAEGLVGDSFLELQISRRCPLPLHHGGASSDRRPDFSLPLSRPISGVILAVVKTALATPFLRSLSFYPRDCLDLTIRHDARDETQSLPLSRPIAEVILAVVKTALATPNLRSLSFYPPDCLAPAVRHDAGNNRDRFVFFTGFGASVIFSMHWAQPSCGPSRACRGGQAEWSSRKPTQGQMDGFFSQLQYKCHVEEVASVGD